MANADDNSGFQVEKLTAENYFSWTFNMKMFLIAKDLWEIVTGAETLQRTASQEEQKRFKKRKILLLHPCMFVPVYRFMLVQLKV